MVLISNTSTEENEVGSYAKYGSIANREEQIIDLVENESILTILLSSLKVPAYHKNI